MCPPSGHASAGRRSCAAASSTGSRHREVSSPDGRRSGGIAYLMGNQVIAERMYRHDLAVMLHVQPGHRDLRR